MAVPFQRLGGRAGSARLCMVFVVHHLSVYFTSCLHRLIGLPSSRPLAREQSPALERGQTNSWCLPTATTKQALWVRCRVNRQVMNNENHTRLGHVSCLRAPGT